MLDCKCGGKLYRHGRVDLKSGGEKMRFRCRACGCLVSFYRDRPGDNWREEKRSPGRAYRDSEEFVFA